MNLFRAIVESGKPLIDKLLDQISDIDIYCELIGIDLEPGQTISSPIRPGDDCPSFCIYAPDKIPNIRPEELWFKDYRGTYGNVFKFVQEFAKFHYDLDLEKFVDIVRFIDDQIDLGIFSGEKREYTKRAIDYEAARERKEIFYASRPFTRRDIFWWAHYGVDVPLLQEHNIKSVGYLLNDRQEVRRKVRSMELAFAYHVYDKLKIYQPESVDFKWRNNCPTHYLQGGPQCKRNDVLIITKSMKDLLCFKSFMNIDAVAVQGEGNVLPQDLIDKIKARYKKVYVVMDYDPAGIASAERLAEHGFELKWVDTNQIQKGEKVTVIDKDISDLAWNRGLKAAYNRMREMFSDLDDSFFRPERLEEAINNLKQLKGE